MPTDIANVPPVTSLTASNPGTSATDSAILEAKVAATTSGDPMLRLTVGDGAGGVTTRWTWGVDNSDSDKLKLEPTGSVGGGSPLISALTGGQLGFGLDTPNASARWHFDQNSGSAVYQFVTNASAGNAAQAGSRWGLDPTSFATKYLSLSILGTAFTTAGVLAAQVALVEHNPSVTADFVFSELSAGDIVFATTGSRTERLRLLNAGQLKFASASITANGAGAVTAPGAIGPSPIAVQEWLTVKNPAGTTRYIPLYG